MKRDAVVKFLECVGVNDAQTQKRAGWVISSCPFGTWRHDNGKSSNEAFGVKDEQGDPFANCFSCQWHGKLSHLLVDLRSLNKEHEVQTNLKLAVQLIAQAEDEEELDFENDTIEEHLAGKAKSVVTYFDDWWFETFPKVVDVPIGLKYCQDRGVPLSLITSLDLRFDTQQQRVCFPVRDRQQRLVGLHGRALSKETDPRYRMYTYKKTNNPQFWLGENWIDFTKPLVVVEGPFDIASVMRVYRNVASPLFASASVEKLKRMGGCTEWITLYDNGKAGDLAREKVDKHMTDLFVTHLKPEAGEDPGSMDLEAMAQLLSEHVTLDEILEK